METSSRSAETSMIDRPRRHILLNRPTFMLAGALVLVSIGVIVLYRILNPPTYHVTMTTGSFSGANYGLVTRYLVPQAHHDRVDISMVETGGSEDTLNAVQDGRAQVAIVDGGLGLEARPNVREVAPLFLTALHVLMKREIFEEAMATNDVRRAFRGKTISLSNEGSGTRIIALKELSRLGITPNDFTETPRTVATLVDRTTTAVQVPEVVIAASLLPSPVATRLVRDFDYRLFPLEFAEAVRVDDKSVYGVTIPAGTYGIVPNVPDKTVSTIGRRLLLIAHKDVPDGAVTALARATFEGSFPKAYDPPLTTQQFDLLPEFPRHPGAEAFAREHDPLTHSSISMILEWIIAAGALACFPPAFFIVRDSMRAGRQRGDAGSVRDYMAAVSELEAEAFELDESDPQARAALLDIRRRLSRLKLEALDAHQRYALNDVDQLDGFLVHVSDLRAHLSSLILATRSGVGA